MGGVVLQSLLINHPGKVSKAVLLATFPNYTSIQQHWLDSLLILREAGASRDVLATASLPWGFTPHTLLNHDRLQALLDLMKLDPEPTGQRGLRRPRRTASAASTGVPTSTRSTPPRSSSSAPRTS